MSSDRLIVWKFDSAPAELRARHRGRQSPDWVALIPAEIGGADLEAVILAQAGLSALDRYQTETGDVVYFGSSDPSTLLGAIDLLRLDDFTQNPDSRLQSTEPKQESPKRSRALLVPKPASGRAPGRRR